MMMRKSWRSGGEPDATALFVHHTVPDHSNTVQRHAHWNKRVYCQSQISFRDVSMVMKIKVPILTKRS